jgi:hypothetical protein
MKKVQSTDKVNSLGLYDSVLVSLLSLGGNESE